MAKRLVAQLDAVLDALVRADAPLPMRAITEATGLRAATVQRRLRWLLDAGRVKRVDHGKYFAAPRS